jgi:hypothetical protein
MQKILQKLEILSCGKLHWIVVGLSLLIAMQVQYIQQGWINQDSVLYLEAAKLFAKAQWQAGFDVFPWPFYALCIAFVSKITTFSIHLSAQFLNVLFFAIASYSFIKIIQLAGGKQRQIIAGALIWLSAQYMIGGVLEMLMRDEGFWAFFLTSLVFFIQFFQTGQLKYAVLWQVCIIIATLFRIEAILYLLFLPWLLLFQINNNFAQKLKRFLQAHSINIVLAMVIISVFASNDALSTKLLGRLNEVFTSSLWQQFTHLFGEKSSIMSSLVLGEYLEEFAVPGLLLTFIYVMCVKTISATGLINIGLAGIAIKLQYQQYNKLINTETYRVLCAAAFIAVINMGLIITKVFVLSSRYVVALSFILMVFAAFYLAEMLKHLAPKNSKNNKMHWLVVAMIIFMLLGLVKNLLPKQNGYNYMQDAVAWLQTNNKENKPVFYEESRMRYYAGAPFKITYSETDDVLNTYISDQSIYQYDYLLVNYSASRPELANTLTKKLPQYREVKRFYAHKNKKAVLILQRKVE